MIYTVCSGVSYTFGKDIVKQFLDKNNLELICRAHQVVEDGYEFQCERHLVTIFSAPNYCGEFDNAGAIMTVSEDLICSFKVLRPLSHKAKFPTLFPDYNPEEIAGGSGVDIYEIQKQRLGQFELPISDVTAEEDENLSTTNSFSREASTDEVFG